MLQVSRFVAANSSCFGVFGKNATLSGDKRVLALFDAFAFEHFIEGSKEDADI